jgi:hypothetical protein
MGRVALFIGGLVSRLLLWLLAAIGALGLLVAGYLALLWPYVDYSHENARDAARWELRDETMTGEFASNDCDAITRDLNIALDANLIEHFLYLIALDDQQRCGDWPDIDVEQAVSMNIFRTRYELGVSEKWGRAQTRFFREVLGLSGNRQYWRRHHEIMLRCENWEPGWVNYELIDRRLQNPDLTARQSRQFTYEFWYQCGRELFGLSQRAFDSDHVRIRASGHWLVTIASWNNNADAIWWREFQFSELPPERQAQLGTVLEEERTRPANSPPCVGDANRRQMLREITGLGHGEASARWLALGLPMSDGNVPACPDSVWFGQETLAWRGGYDTPFWYAVHGIRTGDDMAQAHMPAIEADIGADCMAMARILAGHLENVLPGPPQDIPAARQMIAESIICQPEGMRDPAVYPGGVYEPVETLAFPSFEPRFVPTPVSETISTPD